MGGLSVPEARGSPACSDVRTATRNLEPGCRGERSKPRNSFPEPGPEPGVGAGVLGGGFGGGNGVLSRHRARARAPRPPRARPPYSPAHARQAGTRATPASSAAHVSRAFPPPTHLPARAPRMPTRLRTHARTPARAPRPPARLRTRATPAPASHARAPRPPTCLRTRATPVRASLSVEGNFFFFFLAWLS